MLWLLSSSPSLRSLPAVHDAAALGSPVADGQPGVTTNGYWDPQTDLAALLEIMEGQAAAALADLRAILADVIKETLP